MATNLSMEVVVEQLQSGWSFQRIFLIVMVFFVFAAIYLFYRFVIFRKERTKTLQSIAPILLKEQATRNPPVALPAEVEKYLKEDERSVVRVLQLKGGSASQGTLRIATNYSKAKLSRILTELEQRGVIHKDRDGKRNLVSLR
ncbi:MAG TPA: hypothetical protein VJK52_06320 [Candidatus Nanoarchaeia archaeon]|nr:hypothetical protein [Candidatus Nanoarchaeia archaeon]